VPARILVVDDDPLIGELISEILRSAGLEADSLSNSTEAAGRLTREKYHAVFLDMRMPAPDGVALAQQIRASSVNASTVIVMITGEEDRTVMKRAFDAGVEFFLFKPVERNNLLKLIRVAESSIERERRRFARVRLQCAVALETGKDRVDGTTLDLSLGGMLVQASHVFPIKTEITVRLELVPGKPPLRANAQVVRTIGTDCMGVQFKNFEARESKRLQEFLLPLILTAT
jgi:DNA-binding response OmpR family regulator